MTFNPFSFFFSLYNVSAHVGEADGWKSKLLMVTLGNAVEFGQKRLEHHLFPHLLLCVTLSQDILSGHPILVFPETREI